MKAILSVGLIFILLAAQSQVVYGYQELASEPAPQSAEQIQALVAPVALYPDALVAQVLSASTFPDQVVLAQSWLSQHPGVTGQTLATEVDQQTWDVSVKALTQFAPVLDNMAKNIAWTSQLGEVYHYQPKDVMAAIQVLRAKAETAGNLKSGPQITVVQQTPETIVIQPTNPQIVYVPQYNPTVIYGAPYTTPGYSTGALVATGLLSFGAGMAVGALVAGGSSWGWNTWSVNWHGGWVGYGAHPYYGSAAWHGSYGGYGYHAAGPYGGATSYHGPYGSAATYHGYNASTGQSYHYGASSTAAGGTAYHGTTSTGQHYAGGTTASGQHYGGSTSSGWAHDNGWSAQAASDRGWGSMHAGGFRR